jgi:signal transduction histidine kinase
MNPKVLLVEDDTLIQALVTDTLKTADIQVDVCGTVADAVRLFPNGGYDLVILDIVLPDGNGMDICNILGLGRIVDTPFLFLTAQDNLNVRLRAFEAGAHDYILKPFGGEELLARVKVQFQIKKLHDNLSRKNLELEMMGRARQEVTEMIVHDLKSPLTTIMVALSLIKSRGLITGDDKSGLFESARVSADFMLFMVNDLLDIGHAETTGLKTELAPFELTPFFDKIRPLFTSRLAHSNKTLVFRAEPGLEMITTDNILLFRMLVNLIANALKVSAADTSVEVEFARDGGGIRIGILDRGPGVPDAMKKAIFEKYSTQQSKTLSEDGGTGIGLTFCRLAARALNGRIGVEDRPGGGSVFIIQLPAPAP